MYPSSQHLGIYLIIWRLFYRNFNKAVFPMQWKYLIPFKKQKVSENVQSFNEKTISFMMGGNILIRSSSRNYLWIVYVSRLLVPKYLRHTPKKSCYCNIFLLSHPFSITMGDCFRLGLNLLHGWPFINAKEWYLKIPSLTFL